jgi:hypothetical protein
MIKKKILALALKNARSHYPEAHLDQLQSLHILRDMPSWLKDLGRSELCDYVESLTRSILHLNKYKGRQRKFCSSGLNCDCDIPCGA